MTDSRINNTSLLHKERHWKDGMEYLLEYFKTEDGIKSQMTPIRRENDTPR